MGFIPDNTSTSNALFSLPSTSNHFLKTLYGVNISNVQNSQLLSYNATSQK